MTRSLLMSDQTLFRDYSVFEITHLPETFNYRDTQLQDLAFALRPAVRGSTPLNTVLRGPPGTGKTTAVRRIFAEVEEVTRVVVPVLVSCQLHRTAYAVYSQVYLALFGQAPPESGIPLRRLVGRITQELTRRGAVLVVCLDDAGYLVPENVLNDLLASILRMHEGYPGTRTGVVLTISDVGIDLVRCLDPATLSVLQASEVYFPLYTAGEVREILTHRIRAGLYPGVVPPAALDLLVERTNACGDLRVGLEMIRRAVIAAETDARTEVTEEDVLTAYAASRNLQVAMAVASLDAGDREVLDAVLEADREEEEAVIAGTAYIRAREKMPMSYTGFYHRLHKLERLRLVDLLVVRGMGQTRVILVREGVEEALSAAGQAGATGIAAGCAGRCAYCITRAARGPLRSRPKEAICREVEALVGRGAYEVQVTGQDVSAWGMDLGERLPALIDAVSVLPGDFLLRLGMMNPATAQGIAVPLARLLGEAKVFSFVHLPVQSGSDAVLAAMRRGYTAGEFEAMVAAFRKACPEVRICTDFIVGYPTETEEDFAESMALLRAIRPEKVNVTRYSPRPGTPAAALKTMPERIAKDRSRILDAAAKEIYREQNAALVGETVEAVVTCRKKEGSVVARDRAYREIVVPGNFLPGERLNVRITGNRTVYLTGRATSSNTGTANR